MLVELICTEFKSNEQQRPVINFNSGLNTVLGDNVGSNSIGKSTFLMIIDFVFGGDDYIDKSQDVQRQIGEHLIQFAFLFKNKTHYFSRNTVSHNRVNKCNSKYNIMSEISIDEFRKFLFYEYAITLPSISFREIVSRYFRIYRRDNFDENHPLRSVPQENMEASITSLMKLFNFYANIEKLRKKLKEAVEKNKILKKSIQFEFIQKVSSKQVKENETIIKELTKQLEEISGDKNSDKQLFFDSLLSEDAKRLSMIKKELASLRQQKSRLESKIAYIQNNLESEKSGLKDDFNELKTFFPSINIKKFKEIETFHLKLRVILENEFNEEYQKNKILLDQIEKSIDEHKSIIDAEGLPDETTRKELDEYHTIKKQIEDREQQNIIYKNQKELKETVNVIQKQFDERQDGYLRELQNSITRQMEKFNNFIYYGQKKAPVLTFESGNKYIFETPDDTGTGISFKGLVVYDLSILALTCLPVLIHDSVVLKQIADAPLEKILELYQQSGKQIFIALDKVSSYPQQAQNILEQSAVIHLSDNGNELFGRSWSEK